jgi:hypothetical protein
MQMSVEGTDMEIKKVIRNWAIAAMTRSRRSAS